MIGRHETHLEKIDIWAALAAKLPAGVVSWRQDGRIINRDGRYLARFVAYIEANTVRERLDSVVPGEWDITLEPLPPVVSTDDDANMGACNFKARLQILGVIREDVGTGKDWKQAATDAMKRAAVRFGIGHELYAYEQNWVQMDGDGKFARPLEDPAVAYARRYGRPKAVKSGAEGDGAGNVNQPERAGSGRDEPTDGRGSAAAGSDPGSARTTDSPECPECGKGNMYDNRLTKRNPKAPDFRCRDRRCSGIIWPPRADAKPVRAPQPSDNMDEPPAGEGEEEIPF